MLTSVGGVLRCVLFAKTDRQTIQVVRPLKLPVFSESLCEYQLTYGRRLTEHLNAKLGIDQRIFEFDNKIFSRLFVRGLSRVGTRSSLAEG